MPTADVPPLPETRDALRALYASGRTLPSDRPHVVLCMVSSADGGTAHAGVSEGLSSGPDRRLLVVLRSLADVVLVGAGTVRAEGYGPVRPDPSAQDVRRDRGQVPAARAAVVTTTLDLDWSSRLFTDAPARPLVVAPVDADARRLAEARQHADVVQAGEGWVDVAAALRLLAREHGVREVSCEGGAVLNGHLVAADVVDELCLTVAPLLVSGEAPRAVRGPALADPAHLVLRSVRESDGSLFLRYVRSVSRDR